MPTIIPSIISQKLLFRYSVTLRLPALLAIRRDTRPGGLPGFALARLRNTTRAITMSIVSERSTGSSRLLLLLGVDVVQAVHAALVVLAADVEVEAESGDRGDST